MTLGFLPAPVPAASVGAHRFSQQQRLIAELCVYTRARAAPAAHQTRCHAGGSGAMPALQPRPVPSPKQSEVDSKDERPEQPDGVARAAEQQDRRPDGTSQRPRQTAGVGGRSEPNQQRRGWGGGTNGIAKLPAGDAEADPGRGPAKRSLDVGSPRRREATLARALLRLPAAETDYGIVLGDEKLTGPEITRYIECSAPL